MGTVPTGLIKENAVHPEGCVSCLTAGHKTDKVCQPLKTGEVYNDYKVSNLLGTGVW